MAYTTINKSTDYFNTKLYTGNGGTQSITGVGFQPDWCWFKSRSDNGYAHLVYDSIRGVTKRIKPNDNSEEGTDTGGLTAFNSDGFSIGDKGSINGNGSNFASWNWKAGGATGSTNTDGDITSTVSANTTAGFSIVKYTGNGSNDQRIGHGLGVRPSMWMIKRLTGGNADWIVYHQGISSNWYDDTYLYLNESNIAMGAVNAGTGNPTSSVFYIGNDNRTGGNTFDYIAYVFTEKTGYSKFGYYIGNNNENGPFVYTGFKPAFVMVKIIDTQTDNWAMYDNKRNPFNLDTSQRLRANDTQAETTANGDLDFLSNGFKVHGTDGEINGSGAKYIYMAFGQSLVGSNNVPCTAR